MANKFTNIFHDLRMKYAAETGIKPLVVANPLDPTNMDKTAAGLWVRRPSDLDAMMYRYIYNQWNPYRNLAIAGLGMAGLDEVPELPVEDPFEINMMEALVGWKAWAVEADQLLSPQKDTPWIPDNALKAVCRYGGTHPSPTERCHCGIYGTDDRDGTGDYDSGDNIVGQVYGWGRYVRGERGWRAQYAYPKNFYLKHDQIQFVDVLRSFHVPIFIEQPTLIYNPEEDGYEYGNDETNRDSGAAQGTASNEARGSGGDEED